MEVHHMTEKAGIRLTDTIKEAEEQIAALQATIEDAKAELFALMERNNLVQLITLGEDGESEKVTVTIVRPTRLQFDEAGLRDSLSEQVWRSVSKRVLDKKALEDAIARGKVSANAVAEHSTEVPTKPYLRITRNDGKGE
jgi:hypothetical protein